MKVTFWGATKTVTGSLHEVQSNGARILLECGLYQGRRKEAWERNCCFPLKPESVSAVLLSHAHIDHSGNLPSLVKQGFAGPIYATPATADLCHAMLLDSAHLQEKDALFLNKRAERRKKLIDIQEELVEPLYTIEDAQKALPLFRPVHLRTPTQAGDGLIYEAFEAGHMLGSSALVLTAKENGKTVRVAFSGDVGRPNLPIIKDPEPMPPVDYLIMESTYGDRLHKPLDSVADKLADVINRTCGRGGKVIVPAFAVGRTQQLVLLLHQLMNAHRIPSIPIFVDSPLAVEATEVHRRHPECFDAETQEYLNNHEDPFGFSRLRYLREASESKALNDLRGPYMVISASGMAEAGRILHHLRNNIEDPRNTILITGFQAENTLGRKIVDKWPEVPIFGELLRLRAEVVKINELSGHADQRELLAWMKPMVPALKMVFLVHGEPTQSRALARAIHEQYGLEAVIPSRGDSVTLT